MRVVSNHTHKEEQRTTFVCHRKKKGKMIQLFGDKYFHNFSEFFFNSMDSVGAIYKSRNSHMQDFFFE